MAEVLKSSGATQQSMGSVGDGGAVLKSSGATQQSMGSVGDGGATSSGLVTRMDVSEQVATRSKSDAITRTCVGLEQKQPSLGYQ
ncbi:hypothetical protein QE152_g23733 [Popillia japonica]|uniref:Uncharacterized protein n=1 Tax=Popillia japonica TaxID=7064 RepID=A0AAW1KG42_POPJA